MRIQVHGAKTGLTSPCGKQVKAYFLFILLFLGLGFVQADEAEETIEPDLRKDIVRLEGQIVDLSATLRDHYDAEVPFDAPKILGFKTKQGQLYTLAFTRTASALFLDQRVRDKTTILSGRFFPKSQIFEATSFRYVKNGKVINIYYWCDTCAIRSITGGECFCCREEVVLSEEVFKH